MEFGGNLGCSDREVVKIRILHEGRRAISRNELLDLRDNIGLFKDLHGGIHGIGNSAIQSEYSITSSKHLEELVDKLSVSQQCPCGQEGQWNSCVH